MMLPHLHTRYWWAGVMIAWLIFVSTIVFAATLTPSSSPAASSYTLSDIWNRLTTNTSTTAGNHSFTPTTTPQSTFQTLTQIYEAIPSINAAKVLADTTYLGITGTVAIKSGDTAATATATSTQKLLLTPAVGYYDGSTATVSTTSTSFIASNIRNNTNLFGVTGTLNPDYPGRGWTPNGSGDGSTALTEANCEAASGWEWFEDVNFDGDTTDPEDGMCVKTSTVVTTSWNGGQDTTPNNLGSAASPQTATGGSATTVVKSSAGWTTNAYANHIVKIQEGTAVACWGRVKGNTSDTITVYGSWLSPEYTSNCGTPDGTSTFFVSDDWGEDNTWIGDYSCTGNFPSGTVVHNLYPTTGTVALETADCYDGKRDLLPNEIDRAVMTGTATAADATTVTDSSLSLDVNRWVGRKVLITGGTGANSYGFIESNTDTSFTIESWSGTSPVSGSTYSIIYSVPYASNIVDADLRTPTLNDDKEAGNGPLLDRNVLINWKGTRLPTKFDIFGVCGYKDGGSNYETTMGTYTGTKWYGIWGRQLGRTDEFIDLSGNSTVEYLSEILYKISVESFIGFACSNVGGNAASNPNNNIRARAIFRP